MINLDYASHTPADEDILDLFCKTERECAGNPLAAHKLGWAARDIIHHAKQEIAALFCNQDLGGAAPNTPARGQAPLTPIIGDGEIVRKSPRRHSGLDPESPPPCKSRGIAGQARNDMRDEIIFTSGASEANNLAVKGIARAYSYVGRHILSSCLEHPSVSGALQFLGENGFEIELLKILPNGKIDLAHLKSAIRSDTILLCVSAVDSEIGAIQPLEEIAAIAADYPNLHLHIDAAQAVGKIALAPEALQRAATFCFAPHKFHGLNGCGVLVKRGGVVLEPLIHGGSEANGLLYRGGTPSPAMAAACAFALRKALVNQHENAQTVAELKNYLTENLPKQMQVSSPSDGSPYILNLSAPSITGAAFRAALNERGFAVSVKSACSSDNAPSRAVFAVTGNKKTALNAWRVSFSHRTARDEVNLFLVAVRDVLNSLY